MQQDASNATHHRPSWRLTSNSVRSHTEIGKETISSPHIDATRTDHHHRTRHPCKRRGRAKRAHGDTRERNPAGFREKRSTVGPASLRPKATVSRRRRRNPLPTDGQQNIVSFRSPPRTWAPFPFWDANAVTPVRIPFFFSLTPPTGEPEGEGPVTTS